MTSIQSYTMKISSILRTIHFANFSFHSSQRLVEDIEYVELCHKAAGEDRTSPRLENLALHPPVF